MKAIVIIPAWNEEKYIEQVVKKVKKIHSSVLVVDDGSTDKTTKLAKKAGAIVLTQKRNKGKGAAARKGCDYALKNGFDTIILMDADGQHLPKDIPRFIKALKGKDMVFGCREKNKYAPWVLTIGNWGLTILTRILFGMNIKDTQSGFRAFTTKAYKQLRWKSNDYGMESEMIFRAKGLDYTEIEIKRIYLDRTKGTSPIHGFRILKQMIAWKLKGR